MSTHAPSALVKPSTSGRLDWIRRRGKTAVITALIPLLMPVLPVVLATSAHAAPAGVVTSSTTTPDPTVTSWPSAQSTSAQSTSAQSTSAQSTADPSIPNKSSISVPAVGAATVVAGTVRSTAPVVTFVAAAAGTAGRNTVSTTTMRSRSTAQTSTVQTSTVQTSTVQKSTVQKSTVQSNTAQNRTVRTETVAANQVAAAQAAAPSRTYALSPAVRQFLAGLKLTVGNTVTGTLNGSTLTVAMGAPAIPVSLPAGVNKITFSGATLVIDEARNSATLTAAAAATTGTAATLKVSVANASTTNLTGADLSAAVTVSNIGLFGTAVTVTGKISYAAGAVSASLTGALAADAKVASALTVLKGSTVTLSTATGLRVSGTAKIGTGAAVFTVAVAGAVTDAKNWAVTVSTAAGAPSFTPIDNLTITPAFTGSISVNNGAVRFSVSGSNTVAWNNGSVHLALSRVQISNQLPPAGLSCPGVIDGQTWLDLKGTLTVDGSHVNATAEACVNPAARTFAITGTMGTDLAVSTGVSISNLSVRVDGDLAARSVKVTGHGQLNIDKGGVKTSVPVGVTVASDGSLTIGGGVDLAVLGTGQTGSGVLLVSTRDVPDFDPAPFLPASSTLAADPFDLHAGVTLLLNYEFTGHVSQVLQRLGINSGPAVQARASLSDQGFETTIDLDLKPGKQGVLLGATDSGFAAYLNTVSLDIVLTPDTVSFKVGGTAYLVIPSLDQAGQESDLEVSVSGSFELDLVKETLKLGLNLSLMAENGAWQNAFGISGLQVGSLGVAFGILIPLADGGIPVPTVGFAVHDLVLPDAWASAIGMTPGAILTAAVNVDAASPLIDLSITPPDGSKYALTPFKVLRSIPNGPSVPDTFVNSVQVTTAQLIFAPLGATDATGVRIDPGVSLKFKADLLGRTVDVAAAVAIKPFPSLTATVSFPGFELGGVAFDNSGLYINLNTDPSTPAADLIVYGGISSTSSLSTVPMSFRARLDMHASTSLLDASVILAVSGGLPGYITGSTFLTGSVSGTGPADMTFAASGTAAVKILGQPFGSIHFSYSSNTGTLFNQASKSAEELAAAFHSYYNWADTQTATVLKNVQYTETQVASALRTGYHESLAGVTATLLKVKYELTATVSGMRAWFNATGSDIAAGMQQMGYTPDQITGQLSNTLHLAQAEIYNSLQSINAVGEDVLKRFTSLFNSSGSFAISVQKYGTLYLDVPAAGATTPGTGVYAQVNLPSPTQYWYVLPTSGGYAELINRNSGLCLAVGADRRDAGAPLVQDTCTGGANEQWFLRVNPGDNVQAALNGSSHVMYALSSGMAADVAGEQWWPGGSVIQYPGTGGWNQSWKFSTAIF